MESKLLCLCFAAELNIFLWTWNGFVFIPLSNFIDPNHRKWKRIEYIIMKFVFSAKSSGNIKCPRKLHFLRIWFNYWGILIPEFPSFFCICRQEGGSTSEPSSPIIKPNREWGHTLVINIEGPRMGIQVIEESYEPCYFIVLIIVTLWVVGNGKSSFFKRVFPLMWTCNISNYTFGVKNKIWVHFVTGISNVNRVKTTKYELIE